MLLSLSRFLYRASRILLWPGVALVVWGELWPDPPSLTEHVWDKAQHFIAYFGLAAMAAMVTQTGARMVLALSGVVALGGTLEILQSLTGRDAEWLDMLANTLGAVTGCAVALALLALVARQGGD